MYRVIWVFSVIAIVSVIIVGHVYQPVLPPVMPSHWNSAGKIDGWQSSLMYIWVIPSISFIIVCVLGIMSLFLRDITIKPYIAYSAGIITLHMLSMHVVIGVSVVQGAAIHISDILRLIAGMFICFSFIVRNVPQNHIVGFRLPWTLANATVWRATHRVGFWGMLVAGVVIVLVTFLPIEPEYMFFLGMSTLLLGVIIPSFYAYWLAKRTTAQ